MSLCLFTEFNSMTYDNVDLQIFRRKAKPIQLFKGRQRRRLHDLCFEFQGYLSFLLTTFGEKRKWFPLQGTWLTEWLMLCLWWKAPISWYPFRRQNSDFHFARSMHSVIRDFLKSSINIVSLKSSVSEYQSFAASYLMDSSPQVVVLGSGKHSILFPLKKNTWSCEERTVS